MKARADSKTVEPFERRQALWVAGLALAAYLPLSVSLHWAINAFLALLLGLRLAGLRWPEAAPRQGLLIGLAVAGVGICLAVYQALAGLLAGTALFVVMLGLKLCEARSVRELRLVVILLGFLTVVQFLFDQSIARVVYLGAVTLGMVVVLVDLGGGLGQAPLGRRARIGAMLAVQALPLTLVFFVLFPRLSAPLWDLGVDSRTGVTGMSDSLELGSIRELVIDGSLAFRVRFDDRPPPADQLYWRGPVLWEPGPRGWKEGLDPRFRTSGALLTQADHLGYEVVLEPSGQHWLFALDLPVEYPGDVKRGGDFQLLSAAPVQAARRYRVTSALSYTTAPGLDYVRGFALRLPPNVTPRMRRLAESFRAAGGDDWGVVEAALGYFRSEEFHYTLSPPELGANPVDAFLFESRKGFCEHYSSSFAILMRLAGIPSRVVLGYLGGELNQVGGHYMVWQSDAHAWTEVLIPERGWVRVDPTAAVDPARVDNSSASRLLSGAASVRFELDADGDLVRALRQARYALDAVQAAWQDWVLDFSRADQASLLAWLGFAGLGEMGLALMMIGACGVVLGVILLVMGRQGAVLDPLESAYGTFCARLGAAGLPREAHEGPADYGARVLAARPDLRGAVEGFLGPYVAARYGRGPAQADAALELRRRLRGFRPRARA
jgi:transglutaminase-like putative cysteine protease